MHWEDRLNKDQYARVEAALLRYREGGVTGGRLYDDLTDAGLTSEEADEMVNIEEEG